jgi:hypothetical protein
MGPVWMLLMCIGGAWGQAGAEHDSREVQQGLFMWGLLASAVAAVALSLLFGMFQRAGRFEGAAAQAAWDGRRQKRFAPNDYEPTLIDPGNPYAASQVMPPPVDPHYWHDPEALKR